MLPSFIHEIVLFKNIINDACKISVNRAHTYVDIFKYGKYYFLKRPKFYGKCFIKKNFE